MSAIVRTEGLVKRYDGTLAVAGIDLDRRARRDLRPRRARTARARRRRCGSSPRSCGRRPGEAEIAGWSVTRNPDAGPARPRVHAGRVRGLRRHEGLGVPGLLRPLLRHPGGRPPADDRRPARARGPRRQARRSTSRRCRAACSSGCASPTRSSTTRRSCCSTSRRPGSTRGRGSSCASCCASCARSARRSSSAATSSPSSRSCARASRSSTAARCWPRAGSPTSSDGCASGRSCASGCSPTARRSRPPARPVRGRRRRRVGGDPRRRHDRARLPRRRRGVGPPARAHPSARACRSSSFARAASDLEELFLQVTAPDREPIEAA